MATINVRQLDDDAVNRLKRRALLNNRSLEGEARHILECAAADGMTTKRAAFMAASDRLRQKTRGRKQTPAEVLIRDWSREREFYLVPVDVYPDTRLKHQRHPRIGTEDQDAALGIMVDYNPGALPAKSVDRKRICGIR